MKNNDQTYEPISVAMISLGCPKNLVESETLLAELAEAGLTITGDAHWADILILNTCGFLQSAQDEASEVIDQMCEQKGEAGRCRCIIVMGCWSQIGAEEIISRWPEVDAVIGVNDRDKIIPTIVDILNGEAKTPAVMTSKKLKPIISEATRLRLTPDHWCYQRISEGCSQRCSFCKIPDIRGNYRSKPEKLVVDEAKIMADDGVKELILIGQETTNYGNDFGKKNGLASLLRKLNKIESLDWIRLMYTYPANFTDTTIKAMAELEKVVKYVDIPLQHISDRILKQMARKINQADTLKLLNKLRNKIDGIVIRTTLIVGFPGETDAEFEELYNFVKNFEFDIMGTFPYSPEPGTRSASFKDQIPEDVKLERLDRLMKLQQKIAFAKAKAMVGKKFDVYIESNTPRRKYIEARHAGQAPEVDPVTLIDRKTLSAKLTTPGSKVRVQCIGSKGYDLIAKPTRK